MMKIDFKPIVARIVAAAIGLVVAKAATVGVAIEISPETQTTIVLAVYGAFHTLSKQIFGKK
jgi:hypothetical protein